MRFPKKKKLLILSILSITFFLLVTVLYVYVYENHYKIVWKYQSKRRQENNKVLESYNQHPNAKDAYSLLEYYIGEEQYELALKYAKACLSHGVDDKKAGGRIHFFIARSTYKIGNIESAKRYLKIALEYAKPKEDLSAIYKTIEQYGMVHLLSTEEWEKYTSDQ